MALAKTPRGTSRRNSKVRLFNNLEDMAGVVGALRDWEARTSNNEYVSKVLDEAYEPAMNGFNLAAAGAAVANKFSHMYEFNTIGINKEGHGTPLSPMSPAARLWTVQYNTSGNKIQKDIFWAPRPAVKINPRPTEDNTGIPDKYIKKIKKWRHTFVHKAMVIESGMSVDIKPKSNNKSGLLFVPLGKDKRAGWTNPRGYIMHKGSIQNNPVDSTHTGTFTAFWVGYWASIGRESIVNYANAKVNDDVRWYNNNIEKKFRSGVLKDATKVNLAKARDNARKEFAAQGNRELEGKKIE